MANTSLVLSPQHHAIHDKADTELRECLKLLRQDNLRSTSSTARWFYKNEDDEFEAFGLTDSLELEKLHQPIPLLGTIGRILRVDSNAQLNGNLLRVPRRRSIPNIYIGAALDEKDNLPQRLYCELQRDILLEAHCGGDAVAVHIGSLLSDICYDALSAAGQTNDMPIAAFVVEKTNDAMDAEAYCECVNAWLDAIAKSSCFDVVPLHHQCSIRVSSSMVSYLLQPDRANLIIYDSDFRLLAVGVHRGEYVPLFEGIDSNPYRLESLLSFHLTLGDVYELTQHNEGIRVQHMVSSFNRSVRVCLRCEDEAMLWSPAITKQHRLKQVMHKLSCIQCIEGGIDGATFEKRCALAKLPASVSALVGFSHEDEAIADQEQNEVEIEVVECSICYEQIEEGEAPMFHGHKDLCKKCVDEWRAHNDGCPKCGAVVEM